MSVRSGLTVSIQTTSVVEAPVDELGNYRAALEYDAPFLIDKLIKDRIVHDPTEGNVLFIEVKRYLVLSRLDPSVAWEMYSRRVDEVWHQFVLFTFEYATFCDRYLGGFVHHRPSNAPELASNRDLPSSTFPSFSARYRKIFGQELPECWLHAQNISVDRRVINDTARQLVVSEHSGMVSLVQQDGVVRLSVDYIAREALTFIATTGSFYVRELPGELTDEERIGIAAVLVEQQLLRVAP